ncbi:hypothetical protein HZF02_24440 [Pseudomonas yamanorum]|nr:hypothetical protein HZF02_24440 [Pseudomonas yamanorum]
MNIISMRYPSLAYIQINPSAPAAQQPDDLFFQPLKAAKTSADKKIFMKKHLSPSRRRALRSFFLKNDIECKGS